jgi:hypothetical protein
MIQRSRARPGRHASVVRRKNGVQPSWSARLPPEADRKLAPNPASEVRSADLLHGSVV